MAHVIYCDPEKDFEVRQLFRSLSPKYSKRSMSPTDFKKKIYPKFNSFLKNKQKKKMEALAKKEKDIQKLMKQVDYSKMWKKKVNCVDTKSFLKRNKDNIKKLRQRQARNQKIKMEKIENSVSNCSFHPKIHKKSEIIKSRSINDWYGWNKKKEKNRLDRLQKQNELEMSKCVGRFRSPQKRKFKNKSVHLSQRYYIPVSYTHLTLPTTPYV